jgi:TolB-like protein/AraC-like DNA-binding protein
MAELSPTEAEFLSQVTALVEVHIGNEQFGVSELAEAMNMSRSNLLRKVKKLTNLSVSQLIREVRLKRGMELLRTASLNVSEVSYQVGFGSTSYFIKCFREYYGYPPGEVGEHDAAEPVPVVPGGRSTKKRNLLITGLVTVVVLAASVTIYLMSQSPEKPVLEKSIAVLPFKNESSDSANVYLINGLMESTLSNLQKIKELKVISRTSAEKYRNSSRSIPEMAKELNVNYFVEGSGQKIGEQILLNIQLIDGTTDKHLWAKQYRREAKDIFELQQEIARNITEEIQVIITPEEKGRIQKRLTENLEAYDEFLKGAELYNSGSDEGIEKSVVHFKKAIELDKRFAFAYAHVAFAYYHMDFLKAQKQYTTEIGYYADQALLYDAQLAESLLAKAMYYMHRKEYKDAIPFLEKAVDYNPNSSLIIGFLADFYGVFIPQPGKYIEYALKGMRIDAGSKDSTNTSYVYLRLGNALAQTGFIDEALTYIEKSLAYDSKNAYSRYVRAFVLYAKNKDLKATRMALIEEFKKDTSRFDILQDIGKVSYYMRDFEGAARYYKRFMATRERLHMDVYRHENMIIAVTLKKAGESEKVEQLINSYKEFLEGDQSLYKPMGYAMIAFEKGDDAKGLEHFRKFAKEDDVQYWLILFLESDPMLDHVRETAEFKKIMKEVRDRFWANHNRIKLKLQEEGLL